MMHQVAEINNQLYYVADTDVYTVYIPTGIGLLLKNNKIQKNILLDWKIPKPPISLLHQFVIDAAHIHNTMGSEVEGFIVTNIKTKNKKSFIMYPEQEVGPATCHFNRNLPEDFALLIDLHSHHTMGCGFSGTDDKDDSALSFIPHLSVVVLGMDKGNIFGGFKTEARLSFHGQSWNVGIDELFDVQYTQNIDTVVKKYVPPVVLPKVNTLPYYTGALKQPPLPLPQIDPLPAIESMKDDVSEMESIFRDKFSEY